MVSLIAIKIITTNDTMALTSAGVTTHKCNDRAEDEMTI